MALSTIKTASIANDAITADKIINDGNLGVRNLIINGAMQVAQRGDTTGVTSSGYYASDRFQTGLNNIGTWDIENVSDAPAGFSNSQKLTCTSPTGTLNAGDYVFCRHKIEAQNLQMLDYGASGAKSLTISFYVKSNKTGNASLEINQQDTSPIRAVALQYTINAANTWEYKEITVAGDASGVINNDNGTGFEIFWWLRSGSTFTGGSHQTAWYERVNADRNASNLNVGATANDTWQITGVQLEVGDTATDFEHRSYGDELRRCQRYFQIVESASNYGLGFWKPHSGVNEFFGVYHYPVEMRATATITHDTSGNFVHQPNIVIQGGSENLYNSSQRMFAARIQPTTTHSVSYALFSVTDYFCDAEL
jgi:hypothetical protein